MSLETTNPSSLQYSFSKMEIILKAIDCEDFFWKVSNETQNKDFSTISKLLTWRTRISMKNIISSKIPFSEEQKNLMYQVTSALNYFCEKLLKEPHVNSNQDISEKINGFIEEMKYVEALFKTKNPDY